MGTGRLEAAWVPLLSGAVQYWADPLSRMKVTFLFKGLSLLSKCSCTQIWTSPRLQGMLQRAIKNMTAFTFLRLETSEAESKAVREGRGRMGSGQGWEKGRKKQFSISVEEALPAGAMAQGAACPAHPRCWAQPLPSAFEPFSNELSPALALQAKFMSHKSSALHHSLFFLHLSLHPQSSSPC